MPLTFQIGLLRAINLAGHNRVGMADLRDLMSTLGLKEGKTLLNSGNIVFRSDAAPAALEQQLERAAAKRFGFEIDFFVRTAAEWRSLIDANPFPKEAKADPSHLLAVVLKADVTPKNAAALQAAIKGNEVVRLKGRCAYIVYPDGIGRSRLTGTMMEKMLGTRGTARNWNTVLKLASIVD